MGPQTAANISEWFGQRRNSDLVEKLRSAGVRMEDKATAEIEKGVLDGLVFVVTGTLPSMSRERAKALIEEHGGKVTGSVSGRTSYVVAGDKPGRNKTTAAEKLGVRLLDEIQLVSLIGQEGPRP